MTIEERAELAVETFAAGKGNCTQSVLCAWEDKISVDHDTLMKLGAGYGAGMGCMQATCGALIGAVMAAGSVTDGKGTPRTARSILTSFQEKSGATICKDLKGVETGKVLCPCAQCVRNAVLAAGEIRTLGTLLTYTRFPVVLVMTASILLRIGALDSKNNYTKNHSKVKHKFEKCAIF